MHPPAPGRGKLITQLACGEGAVEELEMKTDTQLRQDVLDELKWEYSVDATRIGIEVKNQIVILTGRVNSHAEKGAAERRTRRVTGVRGVEVDIDVDPAVRLRGT